jgi:hypothetical protein
LLLEAPLSRATCSLSCLFCPTGYARVTASDGLGLMPLVAPMSSPPLINPLVNVLLSPLGLIAISCSGREVLRDRSFRTRLPLADLLGLAGFSRDILGVEAFLTDFLWCSYGNWEGQAGSSRSKWPCSPASPKAKSLQ